MCNTLPLRKIWEDVLTKLLQGKFIQVNVGYAMNYPVDYFDSCAKNVDNIVGVSNPD